jgi:hypothetical protein
MFGVVDDDDEDGEASCVSYSVGELEHEAARRSPAFASDPHPDPDHILLSDRNPDPDPGPNPDPDPDPDPPNADRVPAHDGALVDTGVDVDKNSDRDGDPSQDKGKGKGKGKGKVRGKGRGTGRPVTKEMQGKKRSREPLTHTVGRVKNPLPPEWDQHNLNGIHAYRKIDSAACEPHPIVGLPISSFERGKLVVRRLRTRMLVGYKRIAIIGSPGSGKSYLLKSLLFQLRRFYASVVVINPSEQSNGAFGQIVSPLHIHTTFENSTLTRIVNRQSIATANGTNNPSLLLVLDDVTTKSNAFDTEVMRTLTLRGRHLGVASIFTAQFSLMMPPSLRQAMSYIIIANIPSAKDRKSIYDAWASNLFDSYEEFDLVYLAITQSKPYTYMVLRLGDAAVSRENSVFYYRASSFPDTFKIGSSAVQKHCKGRLDPNKQNVVSLISDF